MKPTWSQIGTKIQLRSTLMLTTSKVKRTLTTVRRAQRASERSEGSERSVQELEASFAIQKRSKRFV